MCKVNSAALLCGLGLAWWSSRVEAEPPPKVAVQLEGCDGLVIEQLNHFLDVELGEKRAEGDSKNTTRMIVSCADQRVTLTATFVDGETAARDLDRFEVEGRVGARLLALAIAELARRAPRALPSTALETPSQQLPALEHSAEPPAGAGAALVFIAASFHTFDFASAPFWGGTAGVRSFALEPATLQLDLSLGHASRDFPLGKVTTILGAVTPRLGVGQRFEWGSAFTAAGYRVSVAHIAGSAESGADANQGSITGIVSGPVVSGHSTLKLSRQLQALIDAELGYVATPLVGQVSDSEGVQLDGVWFGLSVGLGVSL